MPVYETLGDRMKAYEFVNTQRSAFKGLPLIIRLDGKSFHTFTKGLKRPFDARLTNVMIELTKFLVDITHARIGYTQSDEITLVLYEPISESNKAEYIYGGRFFKIDSLLAARASVRFNKLVAQHLPEKSEAEAVFDCRSFQVPTLLEAYHEVLWRQQDCVKNAKAMAAQSIFSHKSLQGLSGDQMVKKMLDEADVNFEKFPMEFRFGTFVKRNKIEKPLEEELVQRLTATGIKVPTGPIMRTEIQSFQQDLREIDQNYRVDFLLGGNHAFLNDPKNL
jgi:tRNA(His) 5'-end guanylyltransferase